MTEKIIVVINVVIKNFFAILDFLELQDPSPQFFPEKLLYLNEFLLVILKKILSTRSLHKLLLSLLYPLNLAILIFVKGFFPVFSLTILYNFVLKFQLNFVVCFLLSIEKVLQIFIISSPYQK